MTTLLLVEDNEMNRDAISRLLERRGFTVLTAVDGEEGIQLCEEKQPDLVLMDLGLPGIDGFEATRRIKANPQTARIPVVALTARVLTSDQEAAFAAGCDDYDTKPADLTRLVGKIRALLGTSGAP
ncbi:two-component system response regulator [Geothrix limicola]|uniref:Two-component system response regulator n=1 Tax=Geothrix limicola TaxID=2927978 RepID=A0ABQ5QDP4_9BACT|nr:response regulator [Geothrix limicola]GLH72970.1 two-component system response regulator [Geothrix limicola]